MSGQWRNCCNCPLVSTPTTSKPLSIRPTSNPTSKRPTLTPTSALPTMNPTSVTCAGECGPEYFLPCFFFFVYSGVTYNSCTTEGNNDQEWWAMSIQPGGTFVSGKWRSCCNFPLVFTPTTAKPTTRKPTSKPSMRKPMSKPTR